MIIKYILSAIVAMFADILAYLLAPIASLPIFIRVRDGREHLVKAWGWISTHDAPVDAGHVDKYWDTPTTSLGKWWSRVRWIWRNPAYQVSHWLGFSQEGIVLTKEIDNKYLWDSGYPNKTYWSATNYKKQKAFLYERQIYYFKQYCIELQFGWKLYRNDPDKKCMLALRISPFKNYPKKDLRNDK